MQLKCRFKIHYKRKSERDEKKSGGVLGIFTIVKFLVDVFFWSDFCLTNYVFDRKSSGNSVIR